MSEADSIEVAGPPPASSTSRHLLLAGRLVLGAVFVYAAYTKLRNPWMLFAMSIDSYRMLPEFLVTGLARSLPWVELLLGLLLMTGWGLRWVGTGATLLLVGFFSAMLRAQVHGLGIDCGCFGIGEKLGPETLVRDALLVALAVAVTVGAFLAHRVRRAES
jgi:uncharacterized membrane protein YphA (DoxX/SURF4 family)